MIKLKELRIDILNELNQIEGLRINTDIRERHLYENDIGELPSMPKLLLGNTTPSIILQPINESQIIKIVELANKYNLNLVPRAAATSGYGGVIPKKGSIVVELVHFNKILEINKEKKTVTVEPGIIWKDLENKLEKDGLSARMVPTSAPGSTVGGFLAQGGCGFGSYQYGWFEQNVEAATVINPDGTKQILNQNELSQVSGAMGTTGIITSITLKLKTNEIQEVFGLEVSSINKVKEILLQILNNNLPLWHIGFINPTAIKLKNKVPPKTHHGTPHKVLPIPENYIIMLACEKAKKDEVEENLKSILNTVGGKFLTKEITEHEWMQRFNPMKIKRISPSIVPAEVVVPLNNIDKVFEKIEKLIKPPVAIEATIIKGNDVILLCMIPHDSRKFSYNLAFTLSLSILKLAKLNDGRAYASGLFLGQEAKSVHGVKLNLWKEFKKEKDLKGIFNPRKLDGIFLMKIAISLALWFEPMVRIFGNSIKPELKESWKGENGIPGDVLWYAYSCAGCGYCRNVCTLYDGKGWESNGPRGKWTYLRRVAEGKEKFDQSMTDNFLMCTTCERCDFTCQLDLPIESAWSTMRGELVNTGKQMSFPAFELMASSARKEKNIWANFSENRDKWIPADMKAKIKDKADIAYFGGCTAAFVENDIGVGAIKLLDAAGIEFTNLGKDEACCGIPMLVAGRWDVFEEILRHNIKFMKEQEVKTVVTSCPACWLSWHTIYPQWAKKLGIDYNFETKHYSELLTEKISKGEFKFTRPVNMKVTFHDSCHIGRAGGVYEPPRELLKAIPGIELVEMEHNRENGLCCGSVLTRISEPNPTSNILGKRKIDEAIATGAEAIVALCPCCQFQMRVSVNKNGQNMPVKDLAALSAKGLGIELPDYTDYALEMWSVFENVITLMQIENMSKLMIKLIPNMLEALPAPFKAMMQMAKIPGFDKLMSKMMPKIMPLLMPTLMPKVMPYMLEEIKKLIAMPDFMLEQLPDLMPKTMDNMLPHVLPDIAVIVTPVMIDYIKNNRLPASTLEGMFYNKVPFINKNIDN